MDNIYSGAFITNFIEADVNYFSVIGSNKNSLQSVAEIKNPYTAEILSRIRISQLLDIDVSWYSLAGGSYKELFSSVSIPLKRDFYSAALIKLIDHDFSSLYISPYTVDLSAITRISQFVDVDVTYPVAQSPTETLLIKAVEDTYTKQSSPTMNYGTSPTLAFGKGLDGEYYTYLKFDINPLIALYKQKQIIENIYLEVQLVQPINAGIKITNTYGIWGEYSLTWKNTLTTGDYLQHSITDNLLKVDVTSIISSALQNSERLYSVRIETNSPLILAYTKESSFSPTLRVLWRDATWKGFLGNLGVSSRALIKSADNRDFISVVQILREFVLNSKSLIRSLDRTLESSSYIRGHYNNSLPSGVLIKGLKSSIYSKSVLLVANNKDLAGTAVSPQLQVVSKVKINPANNFYSSVFIQHSMETDVESHGILVSRAISSIVQIFEKFLIECTSYINAQGILDLNSRALVSLLRDEFQSTALLRKSNYSDLSASVAVTSPMFRGKAKIPQRFNVYSVAKIRANPPVQLTSKVFMNSTIKDSQKDLYSRAMLDCQRSVLKSNIDIFKVVTQFATSIIRQLDVSEVESIANIVGGSSNLNFFSKARVRAIGTENLISNIIINSSARHWIPNIHAPEIFTYTRKLPRSR